MKLAQSVCSASPSITQSNVVTIWPFQFLYTATTWVASGVNFASYSSATATVKVSNFMVRVVGVRSSPCLSIALTSKPWPSETWFLVCQYIFRLPMQSLHIKVIGPRTRSHQQKGHTIIGLHEYIHLRVVWKAILFKCAHCTPRFKGYHITEGQKPLTTCLWCAAVNRHIFSRVWVPSLVKVEWQ